MQTSPLLERLKARGYEVLYLRDPVDEWTFQSLADYRSIRFQDVAKEGLKFGMRPRRPYPAPARPASPSASRPVLATLTRATEGGASLQPMRTLRSSRPSLRR